MKLKSSESGQFLGKKLPLSKAIGFGFWWNLAPKQLPLILVWSWKAVKMGNFLPKSKAIGFGFWWNLAPKQLPLILVWSWKAVKMGNF